MTNDKPAACSLGSDALERRLAAIAEVGRANLISSEADGDRHLLRFRPRAGTRRRLEQIVAAEAECCSFLDLALTESERMLVLSITAPEGGRAVASLLAEAFAPESP